MTASVVHADVVELVWLLVSVVGLTLAIDAWNAARIDRALVERNRRDSREWRLELAVVTGDLVSARWSVAFQAASVTLGVLFILRESAGPRTPFGYLVVGLLLFAITTSTLRLLDQRRRRQRIIRRRESDPS